MISIQWPIFSSLPELTNPPNKTGSANPSRAAEPHLASTLPLRPDPDQPPPILPLRPCTLRSWGAMAVAGAEEGDGAAAGGRSSSPARPRVYPWPGPASSPPSAITTTSTLPHSPHAPTMVSRGCRRWLAPLHPLAILLLLRSGIPWSDRRPREAAAHALLPQREPAATSSRSRRGLAEGGRPTAHRRLHDDLLTNSAATTRLSFQSSSASLFSYHFETLFDYD
jgi:hypothetical protein